MEKQFKVGQVWRTRDGGKVTIDKIDGSETYPISTACGFTYCADGSYYTEDFNRPNRLDLVDLVQDAPEETPAAQEPVRVFAVGQVWERRDGHTTRVFQVEPPSYGGELVVNCDDGHWRRRNGRISDNIKHPFDLVQLLPVTEPSAPAIADAMIADAAALAPLHDTEAVQANRQETEAEAQSPLRPVNDDDRKLFDALVIDAVNSSGIDRAVGQLDNIRKIIEARRAL